MRMNFETPKMEINVFSVENIVTTSALAADVIKNNTEFADVDNANITTVNAASIEWTF